MRSLYASTRREEFAEAGWPPPLLQAFLDQQYTFQAHHYQQVYPDAVHGVLEDADGPYGRLITSLTASSLHLVDISLLPSYRNRGLGRAWLRRFCELADRLQREATLQVHVQNPARTLYERLGFQATTSGNDVYVSMYRPALTQITAEPLPREDGQDQASVVLE